MQDNEDQKKPNGHSEPVDRNGYGAKYEERQNRRADTRRQARIANPPKLDLFGVDRSLILTETLSVVGSYFSGREHYHSA